MQSNNLALRDVRTCMQYWLWYSGNLQFLFRPTQELKMAVDCCASHFSSAANVNRLNTWHFPSILGPCSVEPQMLATYRT